METSEPVNVVSKPAMSDSMEAEVAGDALADAVPGAGKWDAHRNDSAETIAVPDDLGTLQQIPQLQQSDDHIAVIKRLLFEIRELQTQVQGMSGW